MKKITLVLVIVAAAIAVFIARANSDYLIYLPIVMNEHTPTPTPYCDTGMFVAAPVGRGRRMKVDVKNYGNTTMFLTYAKVEFPEKSGYDSLLFQYAPCDWQQPANCYWGDAFTYSPLEHYVYEAQANWIPHEGNLGGPGDALVKTFQWCRYAEPPNGCPTSDGPLGVYRTTLYYDQLGVGGERDCVLEVTSEVLPPTPTATWGPPTLTPTP